MEHGERDLDGRRHLVAKTQAMVVASVAMAACLLFPPWVHTFQQPGGRQTQRPLGYSPVFRPPSVDVGSLFEGVEIDLARLLTQLGVVAAGAAAATALGRPRQT